jgi:hypothetical protein
MPREITDRGRVVEAIQNLALTAELFEEKDGKQKYRRRSRSDRSGT